MWDVCLHSHLSLQVSPVTVCVLCMVFDYFHMQTIQFGLLSTTQTCIYIDSFFFFCMSICITPIHCLCMPLFLPMYRKVGVPLFCLRCWPKSQVCHNPNSIFPGRCFYSASWAITVIAVIIGIILTLVPLCSRKGLTLGAIYADWLDQPGIPKVRKVLQYFFFFLAEFKIIKYQFMKKTRQFLTFKPDSSLSR